MDTYRRVRMLCIYGGHVIQKLEHRRVEPAPVSHWRIVQERSSSRTCSVGCTGVGEPSRRYTLATWFFYFYIFYFHFLQKYIFVFEIYMNIPRPPRCRAAGAYLQKKRGCGIADRSLGTGSQAAGPQGRPAAGRPEFFFCN